ncbi:MAG: hypothetical protein ACRDGS_10055 [Chloroflexota bacterium]
MQPEVEEHLGGADPHDASKGGDTLHASKAATDRTLSMMITGTSRIRK